MHAHPLPVTLPWGMLGAALNILAPGAGPVLYLSHHPSPCTTTSGDEKPSLIVPSAFLSLRVSGGNRHPQESALTHAAPMENIRMGLVIQL